MPNAKPKNPRVYHRLTDASIKGVVDFASDPTEDMPGGHSPTLWDRDVPGLRLRVGKLRHTWTYFAQSRRRGRRSTVCRRLGFWSPVPNEGLSVREARKAALQVAGNTASGRIEPTGKDALTFAAAFEDYCAYLLRKATAAGKDPTWHKIVVGLGRLYLTPQWGGHTLAEISRDPTAVRDWHLKISKGQPTTGNKVAKVLRATYRYAGKLRRDLPAELPTSGVSMNAEEPKQAGMTPAEFKAWAVAWRKIENKTRKAYFLAAILTGARPGELARVRLADVATDSFVIRKAKAGGDIWIPASPEIAKALKMALKAHDGKSEWLFPARAGNHIRKFDGDDLPLWGNGLRHSYKNISATMKPPVEEMLGEFLQGHTAKGVARKYISTMVMARSDALREAQERISARIVSLLGLKVADYA
jgi:integrase